MPSGHFVQVCDPCRLWCCRCPLGILCKCATLAGCGAADGLWAFCASVRPLQAVELQMPSGHFVQVWDPCRLWCCRCPLGISCKCATLAGCGAADTLWAFCAS
ncbi:hypothetical protein NDU88_000793, partial [Pleurodeles waltl]